MSMLVGRMRDLVLAAAAEFERGADPFHVDWLSRHEVTLHECYTLSERIAAILKGYACAPEKTQQVVLLCGIVKDETLDPRYIEAAVDEVTTRKRVMDGLANLNDAAQATAESGGGEG